MRHQPTKIGKMHISVQQMLAEARELINPKHKRQSLPASSNSHMQTLSSDGHIKDRLRQILHLPEQSYKKIERQRKRSLVKLDTMDKDGVMSAIKVNEIYSSISPTIMARLTDRYHLKTIIHNFQSELIDQRFHHKIRRQSRPLYNKNTVNLLPQSSALTDSKKKSKSTHQQKQTSVDSLAKGSPKIYLTITQQDIIRARERLKQQKTITQRYPKMVNQLIEQSRSRQKHIRSFNSQQCSINPERKNSSTNQKLKDIQLKLQQQEKYEPWPLDGQLGDTLIDFNTVQNG